MISDTGFDSMSFLGTEIGDIVVDATPSQVHRYPSKITENPVEDGTTYADHVTLLPTVLEIQGRVSDASVTIGGLGKKYGKDDAYQELVRLQRKKEPFRVVTGLSVFENMLLEDLSIPVESRDGRSIRFTAILKEILIVGKDTPTNRDRIAEDVRHTALPIKNVGLVLGILG